MYFRQHYRPIVILAVTYGGKVVITPVAGQSESVRQSRNGHKREGRVKLILIIAGVYADAHVPKASVPS